jgi:pimeloyl-ACP methyl ester carboxylesterase
MARRPFRIDIEQSILGDLQKRLRRTRWPDVGSTNGDWAYGTSGAVTRDLVEYWRSQYDWRREEAILNEVAQFKASIDGADLHFVHEVGRGSRRFPLLLLHGWPDSFHRYHKVVPLLTGVAQQAARDTFDVVVPSLPGFGFTGEIRRPSGEQPLRQTARLLFQLMNEELGYARFGVVGGDTGAAIAQVMAIDHPEAVVGIHVTDLGWHATDRDARSFSKQEEKYLDASKKRFLADGAYIAVQTTRPRSLAPGLDDSPLGLASWILDRFHSWSDAGDLMDHGFTKDELLTNIMIYWVTRTIGPSMFTYFAEARSPSLRASDRVEVPVAVALFPKDAGGVPPRSLAEHTLNVRRWTEMPRGGHFAALEEPQLFAHDVIEFFREP